MGMHDGEEGENQMVWRILRSLAWQRQFCRGQQNEQEGGGDRRSDGKTVSNNGLERGLEIFCGQQQKTEEGGKLLLQCHLWCLVSSQCYGTESK